MLIMYVAIMWRHQNLFFEEGTIVEEIHMCGKCMQVVVFIIMEIYYIKV